MGRIASNTASAAEEADSWAEDQARDQDDHFLNLYETRKGSK